MGTASSERINAVFKASSFPQGPAQFLVERFDLLLSLTGNSAELANELMVVAKTHAEKGVSQSDLVSFQVYFLETVMEFDEDACPEVANAWAYTLSHVIATPLIEMGVNTSAFMGPKIVQHEWETMDRAKVADGLYNKLMADAEVAEYFAGLTEKETKDMQLNFVNSIIHELSLPGDDTVGQTINFKQLAAYHAGMKIGGAMFLKFELALLYGFHEALGDRWTGDLRNSFIFTMHTKVIDRLVRYSQKYKTIFSRSGKAAYKSEL